jgi:hypothetical protein
MSAAMTITTSSRTGKNRSGRRLSASATRPATPEALTGWVEALTGWAEALTGWAEALTGWAEALTGWAEALTGWAEAPSD